MPIVEQLYFYGVNLIEKKYKKKIMVTNLGTGLCTDMNTLGVDVRVVVLLEKFMEQATFTEFLKTESNNFYQLRNAKFAALMNQIHEDGALTMTILAATGKKHVGSVFEAFFVKNATQLSVSLTMTSKS